LLTPRGLGTPEVAMDDAGVFPVEKVGANEAAEEGAREAGWLPE